MFLPETLQAAENGGRNGLNHIPDARKDALDCIPCCDESIFYLLPVLLPKLLQIAEDRKCNSFDDIPDRREDVLDDVPGGQKSGLDLVPVFLEEVSDTAPYSGAGFFDSVPGCQQERFDCVPGVDNGLPYGLHIDAGLFQQGADERVVALHEVDEVLYQQSKK